MLSDFLVVLLIWLSGEEDGFGVDESAVGATAAAAATTAVDALGNIGEAKRLNSSPSFRSAQGRPGL